MAHPAWPFRSSIPERDDFPSNPEFLDQLYGGRTDLIIMDARRVFTEKQRALRAKDNRSSNDQIDERAAEATRYPWLAEVHRGLSVSRAP